MSQQVVEKQNMTFKTTHKTKTIGVITAHGWVGISTPVVMTCKYLAQHGYLVDLFIDEDRKCRELGIDIPEFKETGIRIIIYPRQEPTIEKLEAFPDIPPLDLSFVQQASRQTNNYSWLIGFDPHGLIRAALLSNEWNIPFIYHSLEIYDCEDNLKQLERRHTRQALLTITQDNARAEILTRLNDTERDRINIIPNSSFNAPPPFTTRYFRDKFNLTSDTVIVLATGTLLPITSIDDLVRSAPLWPQGFVLVLHGWIPDESFGQYLRIMCSENPTRIFLSTEIIPVEHKSIVFHSADIGLVFYTKNDINLTYAAGSSGKLCDFMQAGIPVIASDIPGMRDIVEANDFGKVVSDTSEIAAILQIIMSEYQVLRSNALKSFSKYDFCEYYNDLLKTIERLINLKYK